MFSMAKDILEDSILPTSTGANRTAFVLPEFSTYYSSPKEKTFKCFPATSFFLQAQF